MLEIEKMNIYASIYKRMKKYLKQKVKHNCKKNFDFFEIKYLNFFKKFL